MPLKSINIVKQKQDFYCFYALLLNLAYGLNMYIIYTEIEIYERIIFAELCSEFSAFRNISTIS